MICKIFSIDAPKGHLEALLLTQLRSWIVIQHRLSSALHIFQKSPVIKTWMSCSNCGLRSCQDRKEVTSMKYKPQTDETARFLKQRLWASIQFSIWVRSLVNCVYLQRDNVSLGLLQGCNRGGKVHSGWSPFQSTTRGKMFSSQGPQALWGKYFWRSCYAPVPVSKLPMCLSDPKQDRHPMPVSLTWSTARWVSGGLEDCWRPWFRFSIRFSHFSFSFLSYTFIIKQGDVENKSLYFFQHLNWFFLIKWTIISTRAASWNQNV